ncbi:DNA-formamidopyrimidine glycosylase family protein [Gemmatimonadota bacterium]
MFELPEYLTLARQINETLPGRKVREGSLGNSPHKFVWYNRTHEEFAELTAGTTVGEARVRGRFMLVDLRPGCVLVLGECGGRILYHEPGVALPKKYHLLLRFEGESALTVTTQMWGAMELHEAGTEMGGKFLKDMRPTPVDETFTFEHFQGLIASQEGERRSAKGLLTQDQLIPGLGNSIAQDILFRAHLHPRHLISDLDDHQRRELFDSLRSTLEEITEAGGRYDEVDLFGRKGGYVRLMDKKAAGRPCPACGTTVEKIQYLGGACYLCPQCQT